MEKLTKSIPAHPTQMFSMLLVVLGLLIVPANSHASGVEEELKLESWMITPFEAEFSESEPEMEDWMISSWI